jgi:hypothetical protein
MSYPTVWFPPESWAQNSPAPQVTKAPEQSSNGSAIKEFEVGDRILCSLQYHRCNTCIDCLGPERDTQYCANIEAIWALQGMARSRNTSW